MVDPENNIRTAAQLLANATKAAAQCATNEAAFRIPFQAAIARAARLLGIPIQPCGEISLIEGRADTVYKRLVIEYECPGALKPS